ncbi:MAG: methionine gamma-lyase family protein [Cyanobacteria bacterium HKST-UBA03]|nr:methionine gamma-lyase family protein [Cyanobacteria bacterium HKST-UBA03]
MPQYKLGLRGPCPTKTPRGSLLSAVPPGGCLRFLPLSNLEHDVEQRIAAAEMSLHAYWQQIEARCHASTARVLEAFVAHGLDEHHFASVTGYAHHDAGRQVTDAIYASVFGAEAALVRLQFVSGTHAIVCGLRGLLAPGQQIVSITGPPYDTLQTALGINHRASSKQSPMALTRQGFGYQQIDCFEGQHLRGDFTAAEQAVIAESHVAFIQRSRGYALRPSLGVGDIRRLITAVKAVNPDINVLVDNCYGEFMEPLEPCSLGPASADLIAGSLIKNPGGGWVTTGGYVAGRAQWVERAAEALTAPGLGMEGGSTFNQTRTLLQGLYVAPTTVKEALKSMSLMATVFDGLGYPVYPKPAGPFHDIIQVIELGSPEAVLAFCKTLQQCSPVGSRLTPLPAVTPGYDDEVVMAGGTFIFGSTIELSADAPMRPPYAVYIQGGLVYSHARHVVGKLLAAGQITRRPQPAVAPV